ncbi:cilia- and flagella-associated protein 70-like isoform X2 [Lytechinus pictus]|uniref:cilia- and flagella-associated protein 70-like isoform X2 n=1 Tax=Lytechinus pictus TaxID=7653 RepID=UPI0030B9F0C6
MATEEDQQKQRPPEPVNITILRSRNLKGSKGETLNSLVRVEYGSNVLGESAKVDAGPDLTTEYNFNAKFDCGFDDPAIIDEIAYKPVLVTFVEVLPKEKKQKEEKTVLLGQCTIDLLPLVKGETRYKSTLQIHPLQGSPLEGIPPDAPRPEMDVVVYVNDPLLTEDQLKSGNLITITAETLYSVPEAWNPTGTQYMYNVTLPFPLTEERESVVVMSNGVLKAANDKEIPSKQKKWPVPGGAQGNAIYIPDKFVQPSCEEQEDGELTSKEDRDFRMEAENEKNRVYWNCERRAFMDPSAVQSLQTKIAKTRYWPVEIMRMPMPSAAKTKGKEEENPIFFHGVAFINMAPLLYPGVKKIRGAYRVHAFTEQEVMEKCKRKGGLADEAARMAANMLRNASPFTRGGKGGKEEKGGKDKEKEKDAATKKQPSQMMKLGAPGTDGAVDPDAPPPQNLEGMQYDEARSYIIIEFELESPIVPKRAPEELAKRVAELVPPRPLFPRRTNGAQKAVEDFHHQVASISKLVLEEFRGLFGDLGDLSKSSGAAQEERRRKLIYELNTTGKYFAFKEQLKHSVVKIVREKYLKTSTFDDKEELQAFLSELYVFLVDQMHVGIGKVLSLEDETPVPAPLTDSAQLKHFAREAEVNENFELASKYYQERIARNRNDADHWFDYGCFCLYINDIAKAEECFKETISINQQHLYGLLLYGVVCAMEEGNEAAETFFEAATCVDPSSILAWTMLGLYYDGTDCDIQAEYALMEARRLNVAHAAAKQKECKAVAAAAAAAAAASAPDNVIEEEEEEVAAPPGVGEDQQSGVMGQENGEGDGSKNGEDMSSEKGSSVPTFNKIPATPTELSKSQAKSPAVKPAPPAAAQVKKRMSISSKDSFQSVNQTGQKGPEQVKRTTSATSQRAGSVKGVSRPGSAIAEPQQEGEEEGGATQKESPPVPETTIFMIAVEFLLEVKGMQFCERALAHELLDPMGGPTTAYHVALARLKLQKKALEEANESLNQALVLNYQDPDAWSILGHLRYLQGNFEEAKDCYERTLSFVADAREMHAIYLRLASIYLQDGQYDKSKTIFLLACKNSPSCISWLGVGIACFRLGELSEAEDALCEANILNNSDPEVWGYLSLVCLRTGRQQEAEQAYKYSLKVGLSDDGLLEEINKTQEEVGFGNPQF